MSKATLYELADDLRVVLAALDDAEDGEIPPDLDARLDQLAGNFADKVDGVLRYRVGLVAAAEGIDAEVKRLTALRDTYARRAEWLKKYVETCMLATGQPQLDTKLFKLSIVKNSRPSIALAAGSAIPDAFKRVQESFDGQAAYEAWKAGQKLPPEVIVKEGCHLRIR